MINFREIFPVKVADGNQFSYVACIPITPRIQSELIFLNSCNLIYYNYITLSYKLTVLKILRIILKIRIAQFWK